MRNPDLGLGAMVALPIVFAAIMVTFRNIVRMAAAMRGPYLVRVAFATVLNVAIVALDRRAAV
ncbi:MAG: tryptophan-rich sensory protein [Bauldia sp.]|uniref:tryptophan-rich sensory protein n=1 Tax=Bauldia sp. TaxID=2575872 RepID=UPI001D83D66A|nr:tryptophan-rich sensory protein [Bauldia sp.]MCB1494223.1 tryptophan-rich sensory protein [Bauldia sp.]